VESDVVDIAFSTFEANCFVRRDLLLRLIPSVFDKTWLHVSCTERLVQLQYQIGELHKYVTVRLRVKATHDLREQNLPQRPGVLDCDFFRNNQTCSYKQSCLFNHPLEVILDTSEEWKDLEKNKDALSKSWMQCSSALRLLSILKAQEQTLRQQASSMAARGPTFCHRYTCRVSRFQVMCTSQR
jgi:hypothetical protein